jgi:hypothetical protein
MRRDLATGPTPDLHVPGVEIRILLQGRMSREGAHYLKESRAKPNEVSPESAHVVLLVPRVPGSTVLLIVR